MLGGDGACKKLKEDQRQGEGPKAMGSIHFPRMLPQRASEATLMLFPRGGMPDRAGAGLPTRTRRAAGT